MTVEPTNLEGQSGEKAAKASTENKPAKAAPASTKNSVSPTPAPAPEPKPTTAKPRHVYGTGVKDDVLYSRVRDTTRTNKSLTVKHLQRRLGELGFDEATADIDARYGDLTALSVSKWQAANNHTPGTLTPEQFSEIFKGDTNVNVVLD